MPKGKAAATTVSRFSELHDRLSKYQDQRGWIFRGHADSTWLLIPKAGRSHLNADSETQLFEEWKLKAIEHLNPASYSDWEWLAIAQHHGLATRLLDWTINPLIAAYFGVREQAKNPAIIYAARFDPQFAESADHFSPTPLEFKDVAIYRPRGVVPRIVRQGGLFSIHGPSNRSLIELRPEVVTLESIVIKQTYREKLRAELSFYGINSASLFPDLDGLAAFLNWNSGVRSPLR